MRRGGRQPRSDPARPDRVRPGRRPDQHRLHRQLRRRRHLRPRGQHQDPARRRGGGGPADRGRPGHPARLDDRRGRPAGAGAQLRRRTWPWPTPSTRPCRWPGCTRTGWSGWRSRGCSTASIEFLPDSSEMEARRGAPQGPDRAGAGDPARLHQDRADRRGRRHRSAGRPLPGRPSRSTTSRRPLRERYADVMPGHRLHREIVTTRVVNEFVDHAGITCFHRLSSETGAGAADLIQAQIAARAIFGADELDDAIAALDHQVAAQTQTALRMEVRTLVERATRWLVNNRRRPIDIASAVTELAAGRADGAWRRCPRPWWGATATRWPSRLRRYARRWRARRPGRAGRGAARGLRRADDRPDRRRTGRTRCEVAEVHFALGQRLGLDRLLEPDHRAAARRPLADDGPGRAARRPARGARPADRSGAAGGRRRVGRAFAEGPDRGPGRRPPPFGRVDQILRSISSGRADLARISVGLRLVRGLLSSLPERPLPRPRAADERGTVLGACGSTCTPTPRLRRHRRAGGAGAHAAEAGLDVVALTDHDTFDGLDGRSPPARSTGSRWSAGWSSPAAARQQRPPAGLRCGPGEPGSLAAEMERVRDGRMGRLGPRAGPAGRAGRAGHRGRT